MTTSTRPATTPRRSGLDLAWIDTDTRPQDDLFGHVNGRWLQTHEIPEDRAQDGAFRALRDRAEIDVRAIIEGTAGAAADSEPGSDARKIGDLYRSFMDAEAIEAAGVAPLRPLLEEVSDAGGRAALAAVLGRRQREGLASLFGAYVSTDAKDSTRYLVHLSQSGLGLPDESYYRDEANAAIRAKYVAPLARLAEQGAQRTWRGSRRWPRRGSTTRRAAPDRTGTGAPGSGSSPWRRCSRTPRTGRRAPPAG